MNLPEFDEFTNISKQTIYEVEDTEEAEFLRTVLSNVEIGGQHVFGVTTDGYIIRTPQFPANNVAINLLLEELFHPTPEWAKQLKAECEQDEK